MHRFKLFFIACLGLLGLSVIFPESALAQTTGGDVEQVSAFLKSAIQAVASLTGLVATGFFILGGLSYITSSGNPLALQKAKRTLVFAALGLAITIAAFALTDIVSNMATKAFGS